MILAIDPGTKCGWAIDKKQNGVWDLHSKRMCSEGMRFKKLREHLQEVLDFSGVSVVVFEEVRAHNGVTAAHVYGGLVAIIQEMCIDYDIDFIGVPVGTIKKFATGKGSAKKQDMIVAANEFFPSVNIKDDNHADALCILAWAKENIN